MTYATLAAPALPTINVGLLVQSITFTAQSILAAALIWTMLAGPGFLTDHASTAPTSHLARVK